MLTEKNTSDKYKYCEFCGRTLPKHYEGTLCPTCQEAQLFRNVRDYIRANTVNEYEVAEERFDNISKGGLQYGTF